MNSPCPSTPPSLTLTLPSPSSPEELRSRPITPTVIALEEGSKSNSPLIPLPLPNEDKERERMTPSPDRVKCAICLGDLVNKSYSNSCIHQFCFGCLLEWSKIKAECPLCKAQFASIYHNIRSNSDYDEYVVPPPPAPNIPHFSIRLSSGSPEVVISRGGVNYPIPSTGVGVGDFLRPSVEDAMRSRSGYTSRLQRDPRILRWLSGPASHVDVLVHGHNPQSSGYAGPFPENPFESETPELFGGLLEMTSSSRAPYSPAQRFSGYQTRRRRYDRNQWVRPFDSSLNHGTLFFPSVEYFQRHPSAMRRISPWLHRELTVLMNLTSSRTQMAFAFDLVISLLTRYDIRSAEFRDLMRPYLGNKTRHFQHEFYHYVLSGMRTEEYDNIASYSAPSSRGTDENPFTAARPVVTLESDSDEEIRASNGGQTNNDDRSATLPFVREDREIRVEPRPPSRSASIELALNEFDAVVENVRRSSANNPMPTSERSTCRNAASPEMPILEPQVDLNNLSKSRSRSTSRSRRNRRAESSMDRVGSWLDSVESETDLFGRSRRPNLDPEDGRRSPYPRDLAPDFDLTLGNLMGFPATSGNEPLRTHDFPILELRENRERRRLEMQESATRWPSIVSSSVSTPPQSSSSVQIRIYPQPMDLSTHNFLINPAALHSRNLGSHDRHRSLGQPEKSTQTRTQENLNVNDEGECEFLGVHPIQKKPPLAVITLSDDEDDARTGSKSKHHLSSVNDVNDPKPGTSAQMKMEMRMDVRSLPPKRRFLVSPHDILLPVVTTVTNLQTMSKKTDKCDSSLSPRSTRSHKPAHSHDTRQKERRTRSSSAYNECTSLLNPVKRHKSSSKSKELDRGTKLNSDIDLGPSDVDDDEDNAYRVRKLKKKERKSKKEKKKPSKSKKALKPGKEFEDFSKNSHVVTPEVQYKLKSCDAGNSKLKSVVVKVDKGHRKLRPMVLNSDSSRSDDDFQQLRLRSVIGSVHGSTGTPSVQTSSLRESQTPLTSQNLLSPTSYVFESLSTNVRPQAAARRWESDDDEDNGRPKVTASSDCDSLLSVGGAEDEGLRWDQIVKQNSGCSEDEDDVIPRGLKKRMRLQIESGDSD